MEEGDIPLSDPATFELANISASSSANTSSDDDAGSMSSRSSGRKRDGEALPRRALLSPYLEEDGEREVGSRGVSPVGRVSDGGRAVGLGVGTSSRQGSPRRKGGRGVKEFVD